MGAGNAPRRGGIIEGINVTPLVDITLVLMVVFIVTAKIMVTPAVPLDLPQASQSEDVQTVFAVAIDAEGALHVDGKPADEGQLSEQAKRALAKDHELRAVIQADGDVKHRRVIGVLDLLKAAGLTRVAFGTATAEPAAPARDAASSADAE